MFFSAAVAYAQTWPSDAQVFRDVYGQVDADGATVRWDAAKESRPSPFVGHSFAATGQEMKVEILLRAEVEGKLYVATTAVPKGEDYECHSCMAAVGGAVYTQAKGGWKPDATSPAAIYAGAWGKSPVGMELRWCGEQTYCFVVEDGFTGQGYTETSLKVFGPVGESVRSLLSVPVESDDEGAYDPKGIDGPSTLKRMAAGVRFEPGDNRSPFFDLEVMILNRNCSHGHCADKWKYARFRYRDGEYIDAVDPVARGSRQKAK